MTADPSTVPSVVTIEPARGWVPLRLRELWAYRELLYFLTWRDVKVRYKQTALGAAWAVIQPFTTMIVFTFVFGHVAKVPTNGIPYPIFSFAALLPWTFFASGLQQSVGSLVGNSNLITKVYFPRLVMPIAAVFSGALDFLIAFIVLGAMMGYYGIAPPAHIVFLPLFLLLALVTALGVGLWLSALNVRYRDVKYVVPFLVQIWLYASPIGYSIASVGKPWRTILGLNPLAGVVEGFRWALLGHGVAPDLMTLFSALSAIVVLVSGAFYFRRMERTFADLV